MRETEDDCPPAIGVVGRCHGAGCGVVVVTDVAVLGCSGHRSGASCLQTSLYNPLPLLTGGKYEELIIRHFYNCRFIKTYISLIPTFHDALLRLQVSSFLPLRSPGIPPDIRPCSRWFFCGGYHLCHLDIWIVSTSYNLLHSSPAISSF